MSKNLIEQKNFVLSIILSIFQVLDGVLTYFGVLRFGIESEANPLIRAAINTFGLFNSLFFVKVFALFVIFFLYKTYLKDQTENEQKHLYYGLTFLVTLYAVFAVFPWTYMLFFVDAR